MDCSYFESRLEALADGRLAPVERRTCEEHAAGCPACWELLALASLDPAPAAEVDEAWLGELIARTSGSACVEAEAALCARMAGELPLPDLERVEGHLAGCAECAALASTLGALAIELPRMAEVRPDERFVDDVLARSLPVPVRLRRYWASTWPRWVRRPRFASEAAYVGVLVLVLVFATPGSPLEAVPRKALDAVSTDSRAGLTAPVAAAGDRFESTLQEWWRGSAGGVAKEWYETGEEALERARGTADGIEDRIEISWGTLRGEIASLLVKAEAPISEPAESTEEKP
jgi:predicted anti-sigma-YlaC factor YlaD